MWIKHALLEIAVTLLIVLATIPDLIWARWIVIAYTILMLVLKIVALLGGRSLASIRPTSSDVPRWFWHVNYGVNILLLGVDVWWWMAAAWLVIWILSVIFDRRVHVRHRS